MKKLLIFTALLFSGGVFSQAPCTLSAISRMPYEANNYLILDQQKNPDVTNWLVSIQRLVVNSNNSSFEFENQKQINLIGENYIKLDIVLLTGEYYVNVKGYNAARILVVEEGPLAINGEPSTQNCSWSCKGKTYAYKINNWVHTTNGSGTLMMDVCNPAGLLINKFKFSDGSEISIQTIK